LNVPDDLKYTRSHEWIRLEGDVATIGITEYAQSELGDIVYVDLPSPGRAVAAGDSFGTIESVKTVSDIYAPLAGEIIEVNPALDAQSELLNSQPYEGGWIVRIRFEGDANDLLGAAEYKELITG
jgi:glycine cleavage system H protein